MSNLSFGLNSGGWKFVIARVAKGQVPTPSPSWTTQIYQSLVLEKRGKNMLNLNILKNSYSYWQSNYFFAKV